MRPHVRNLGLLLKVGRYSQVVKDGLELLKIEESAHARYILGLAYAYSANHPAALDSFLRAIPFPEISAKSKTQIIVLLQSLGFYSEAEQFDKLEMPGPHLSSSDSIEASMWAKLAVLHEQQGRSQQALEAIQKALKLNPNKSTWIKIKSQALLDLSRVSEAVDTLISAARKTDKLAEKAELLVLLSAAYKRGKMQEQAAMAWDEARNINPSLRVSPINSGVDI